MRILFVLSLLLSMATPVYAGSLSEFRKQCEAKGIRSIVTISEISAGVYEIEYDKNATQLEKDTVEADKIAYFGKASDSKAEAAKALSEKADADTVSDEEYAKLIRISNMKDAAKRDAEWADLKPELDK